MSPIHIKGVIRGLGKVYASGLEVMEVHIKRQDAVGLNPVPGQRCSCSLEVGNDTYQAGLRATERNPYVWICPNLVDSHGENVKLAEVLRDHGFRKNQPVTLTVSGNTYRLN